MGHVLDIDSPPDSNLSSMTSTSQGRFFSDDPSNGLVYYTTPGKDGHVGRKALTDGNRNGNFISSPGSEINSITMPRSLSYDEYVNREPQWNFGDSRDSS